MKRHEVRFRPLTEADLIALYDYIAEASGTAVAAAYIDRIEAACLAPAQFPKRGTRRDDIRKGLRTIGFEHRATIIFQVRSSEVLIVRILHGGRDFDALFRSDDAE